jgi:hypothetical protein
MIGIATYGSDVLYHNKKAQQCERLLGHRNFEQISHLHKGWLQVHTCIQAGAMIVDMLTPCYPPHVHNAIGVSVTGAEGHMC